MSYAFSSLIFQSLDLLISESSIFMSGEKFNQTKCCSSFVLYLLMAFIINHSHLFYQLLLRQSWKTIISLFQLNFHSCFHQLLSQQQIHCFHLFFHDRYYMEKSILFQHRIFDYRSFGFPFTFFLPLAFPFLHLDSLFILFVVVCCYF